jgi:hypothetical protein
MKVIELRVHFKESTVHPHAPHLGFFAGTSLKAYTAMSSQDCDCVCATSSKKLAVSGVYSANRTRIL